MNNLIKNPLEINEKTYRLIKRSYLKALKEGSETLDLTDEQGKPILVTKYAKYLLEYVEGHRRAKGQNIYEPNKNDHTCKNPNGCGYKWIGKADSVSCPRCKYRQDTAKKGEMLI